MANKRRKHDAAFKAKVAIEAIKERETLSELSKRYEVSQVMISRWKKEFLENSAAAFETSKSATTYSEADRNDHLRKIGELEMELDFAKRVSRKLGIEIPAKH